MDNERQLKICDLLLNLLKKNNGELMEYEYNTILSNKGFEDKYEISIAVGFLIKYGLVEYRPTDSTIKTTILTPKGEKAAIIGIKATIKEYEQEELLKIKLIKLSVNNASWSKASIIVSAIISISLVIFTIYKHFDDKKSNQINNSYYNKNQIDSILNRFNNSINNSKE